MTATVRSSDIFVRQNHLAHADMINSGAYYTAPEYADIAWRMLDSYIDDNAIVFDSACGYGGFLRPCKNHIGCDIDEHAIARARQLNSGAVFFRDNALEGVSREKFSLPRNARLVMIGNPPFNDRTSQIRRHIKRNGACMDEDIRTRDLGMSFLLSYAKLRADIVCVLHPLSYLIKRSNFALLKNFTSHYTLRKAEIISSACFPDNSRMTAFPIVVALYEYGGQGTRYDDVRKFRFPVRGGAAFALDDFQYVDSFLHKYPRRKRAGDLEDIMFFSLRDINALRRNRTFMPPQTGNAVFITRDQLPYYAYIDAFKRRIRHIPYYLGNSNVPIDNELFQQYRPHFMRAAARRHQVLQKYVQGFHDVDENRDEAAIESYLRELMGRHYAD